MSNYNSIVEYVVGLVVQGGPNPKRDDCDKILASLGGACPREIRQKFQVVTVLTRHGGDWSHEEALKLATNLMPKARATQHPQYPGTLVLSGMYDWDGGYAKEVVARVLGRNDFEIKVVRGLDNNPEIPFFVPL